MTETHRVRDLAKMVSGITGAEIDYVENPRNEADENELLRRERRRSSSSGLEPITLADGLMQEVTRSPRSTRIAATATRFPAVRSGASRPFAVCGRTVPWARTRAVARHQGCAEMTKALAKTLTPVSRTCEFAMLI